MTSSRTPAVAAAAVLLFVCPTAAQRGPAPAATGLPAPVLTLACAPSLAVAPPLAALRIAGGQDSFARHNYIPGDLVTIAAGTRDGIAVGQRFFVRRPQVSRGEPITPATPAIVRTAGWIEVYATDETAALATIVHACDTIEVGDYLEPFAEPTVPDAPVSLDAAAPASRDDYARVLIGQDRRRTFGRGDFLTIDRGADRGVVPGARFVIYRDRRVPGNFLFELGEAVAMAVAPGSSTLQVVRSLDAIHEGDYAALRR